MFLLKKIVGYLLMPVPLGLALLTLGLLLVAFRRRVRGWTLLVLGWLILALASNRGISLSFTGSLENHYPPVPVLRAAAATPAVEAAPEVSSPVAEAPSPTPEVEAPSKAPATTAEAWPEPLRATGFVAVLGGGNGDRAELSAGQRLSDSARARLLEGLRLALALPDSWLVVSGPVDPLDDADSATPHARVLADAAVELGFPRGRIVEITTARDTTEEVAALHRLAGEERVALVTSAWHLPRAMRLAESEGLDAFPCPADYLGGREGRVKHLAWVTWDADSLMNTTRAWREYLGQTWAKLVAWWRD